MNYKDILKRQIQTQKRQAQQEEDVKEVEDNEDEPVKQKKYENGKPKKVVKEQQVWAEQE